MLKLKYVRIGLPLALIGGILGPVASVWTLLFPADFLSSITPNTLLIMLGYLSLFSSITIVILVLALIAEKFVMQFNTILILVIILGIVELFNLSFPYIGLVGGVLVVIGGIMARVGLIP